MPYFNLKEKTMLSVRNAPSVHSTCECWQHHRISNVEKCFSRCISWLQLSLHLIVASCLSRAIFSEKGRYICRKGNYISSGILTRRVFFLRSINGIIPLYNEEGKKLVKSKHIRCWITEKKSDLVTENGGISFYFV